jgi:TrmH family RNA methyltransferase
MREISSRQNPVVRSFRVLAAEPDSSGARLLLDGAHLVAEAERAGLGVEIAAVASSRLQGNTEEGRLARELGHRGVDVVCAPDHVLAAMSPVRTPSGLVAIATRAPVDAKTICAAPDPFVLVAIDVQDPGNVGAIVRAGEAGGATGAIACGVSASPFSWKAVRGSMGSALRLPIAGSLTTDRALEAVRTAGLKTVATVARAGRDPDAIDWRGGIALLLGGEGAGLSDDLVSGCDERVTIPMSTAVESLNVSTAAAILVYAARRQRHASDPGRT